MPATFPSERKRDSRRLILWRRLALVVLCTMCGHSLAQEIAPIPLFDLINNKKKGNLLTTDTDEAYRLLNVDFKNWSGGVLGYVPQSMARGTVPIYRYSNPKSGDHFFTNNPEEGNRAVKYLGYHAEGVCCYLFPSTQAAAPGVPAGFMSAMYRFQRGSYHYYAIDLDSLKVRNPKDEGILGWFVDPAAVESFPNTVHFYSP